MGRLHRPGSCCDQAGGGLVGPRNARFSAFPQSPIRVLTHVRAVLRRERIVHLSHNPLGALMVYNIWATIAVIGLTGYLLGTLQFFGVEWVEQTHEVAHNWLAVSIALHVAGLLLDTCRTRIPFVLAALTGRRQIPPEAEMKCSQGSRNS